MDKGSWILYICMSCLGAFLITPSYVMLYDNYKEPLKKVETYIIAQISKKQLVVVDIQSAPLKTYIVDIDDTLKYDVGSKHTFEFLKMKTGDKVAAWVLGLLGCFLIVAINLMLKHEMGWKLKWKIGWFNSSNL